jgi:hypothetical protein
VDVLDFCGPFEVFSVANRFAHPPAFRVLTVAEKAGPVLTRGALSGNPHHHLADCPRPDLLLVPGGQGTRRGRHNAVLTDGIKARSQEPGLEGVLVVAPKGYGQQEDRRPCPGGGFDDRRAKPVHFDTLQRPLAGRAGAARV